MIRLLTFFMMLALVLTQGTAMATALCRHQNSQEHALARQSRDSKIAAVSLQEEAAADAASKKGSQSGDPGAHWPAQLLLADNETAPPPPVERLRLRPAAQTALASTIIPPLLKPPSAG